MKTIFVGVRYEACKAFYDLMQNYGYETAIVTFQNTFIAQKISEFKGASFKEILPYEKDTVMKFLAGTLAKDRFKIFLSAGLPYLLPKEFFRHKTVFVNSHPHVLPKYKGLKVISESYEAGCKEYGVTTHFMNEKPDSGKIILKKKIMFIPKKKNNIKTLYRLLFSFLEPAAIAETMTVLKQKRTI